jgi:hypothetical protein
MRSTGQQTTIQQRRQLSVCFCAAWPIQDGLQSSLTTLAVHLHGVPVVFNDVAVHLWTTFQGLLEWHLLLNYERMALFAEAISDLLEAVDGEETAGFVTREESAVF